MSTSSTESTSIGYGPLAAGLFVAVVIAVVIVQVALIPAITADNKIKFDAMEAKLDAIEKQFPELKDSINAVEKRFQETTDLMKRTDEQLKAELKVNFDEDKINSEKDLKYRDYVNTINKYISNTKALEMPNDVRTRVFVM
jgi:septal ring factor EnvC (AmiA/AmiB activator)